MTTTPTAQPGPWCELCQAPPCVVCHQCGRPLNEFGQCEPRCWAWIDNGDAR